LLLGRKKSKQKFRTMSPSINLKTNKKKRELIKEIETVKKGDGRRRGLNIRNGSVIGGEGPVPVNDGLWKKHRKELGNGT